MSIFPLRPARPSRIDDARVIVDLDRLIAEPVAFRFNGKVHQISAMDTKTFFTLVNEIAKLEAMGRDKDKIDAKELMDAYVRLFKSVCTTISKEDVYNMTFPQIGALFQQVIDCVTGRAYKDDTQKKSPMKMTDQPSIA